MTNACPRCGYPRMKEWQELSDDEQMLAERMPASVEFTPAERKKHRFCVRCWYETEASPIDA